MANDTGPKEGLAAAVEAVGVEVPAAMLPAMQLPLLPTEGARDEGEAEAQAAAGDLAEARGPGRPAGARNRRTEEWTKYLLSQYKSPLVVLAEIYSRPAADLCAELGCTKLEAFRLQKEAAEKLAPYLHQKQPVAIQVDESGAVSLVIVNEAAGGQVVNADGDTTIIDVEAVDDDN